MTIDRGTIDFIVPRSIADSPPERKAKGTELWDAMGRGLWGTHLANDEALRSFAYLWFHNMGGKWITADLKKVFGKRKGLHGHDEPKVDDASWDAVDKAAKIFAERFKPWQKSASS